MRHTNIRRTLHKPVRRLILLSTLLIQHFIALAVLFPVMPVAQVAAAQDAQVDVSYDAGKSTLSFTAEPSDRVTYEFVYTTTEDKQEATQGEREAAGKKVSAELYLGTCSGTVCSPHTLKSGELKLNIEDEGQEQERTFSFNTTHDMLWLKEGETYTTAGLVELDKEYKAPQNDKVVLKFIKLPEKRGTISFTEVKLSETQQSLLKAVSDTAYDITSDMKDGEFEYTLTLPLPEEINENVGVKVSETSLMNDLQNADMAEGDELLINGDQNKVQINSLNHFTTFVIVDTTSITSALQVVTSSSTNWTSVQQDNAAGTFTFGPAGVGSVGVGSYRIKLGAAGGNKSSLGAPNVYNGQPLADLNTLGYSFYVVNPGDPVSTAEQHLAPVMNISLDMDNDGNFDRTLFYDPCRAHPSGCSVNFQTSTWQAVDAMNGVGWSYTDAEIPGVAQYGQTLAYYLARPEFATARLLNSANNQSAIQIVAGQDSAGSPWNEYFEAHIDNVSIGFDSTSDIFDFEPGDLAAPLFWVEEQTTAVQLAWESVPAATGYKIYRSTTVGGTFTLVNGSPIAGNSYSDTTVTTGQDYYYKVTAVSANLESILNDIIPKYAGTLDVVIDDDSWQTDQGASGTVAAAGTGSWDKYAVQAASGVNGSSPNVHQYATGGDTYSTGASAIGQTYSWTTAASLNGNYEVFVNYICDPSRGDARYRVFSDASQLGSDVIRNQGLLATGAACASLSSGNTESEWVSLGYFTFSGQARVEVTADPGQVYIIADAVGFRELPDTVGDLTVCKENASANRLSGWTMSLADDNGLSQTFTDEQVRNDQGHVFANVPAGNYLVEVRGYFDYGDAQMISDAAYNYRPEYIPCNAMPDNPWLSDATTSSCEGIGDTILSVRVDGTLPVWGAYNDAHVYQAVIAHPGGDMRVHITDNNFEDNSNQTSDPLRFAVFQVFGSGVTSEELNGCFQFTGVQTGGYILHEQMQSGWERQSSAANDNVADDGLISVVSSGQEFVFVNEVVTPGPTPTVNPSPSVSPSPSGTPSPAVSPSASVTSSPETSATPVVSPTTAASSSSGGGTGPVANNAVPPVCSATAPSGAPSVSIINTGVNTVTLSWTGVSPVTHYGLYFRRNSDGAEYGATNIGNVNTYTTTNLSGGGASYTYEVFGVNDCAPGPRGQALSGEVGGALLTGRPTGDGGQVLGETTESPTPSPSPSASPSPDASGSPEVLGGTDGPFTDFRWWWAPMVIYAIVVVVLAFAQNNNPTPRRIVTAVGFGLTGLLLWNWKYQPWPWIIGTGIGGAVVELFTTFLLSDYEEEQ